VTQFYNVESTEKVLQRRVRCGRVIVINLKKCVRKRSDFMWS